VRRPFAEAVAKVAKGSARTLSANPPAMTAVAKAAANKERFMSSSHRCRLKRTTGESVQGRRQDLAHPRPAIANV
jgi:hypothetical protein